MGRAKTFNLDVDAFMSDERLNECSANAHGVYIRTMCLMHKNEDYGRISLGGIKGDPVEGLAEKLSRHMPFSKDEIRRGVAELISHRVLYLEDGFLCQRRMIRDNSLARKRSEAGKSGMSRRWSKNGAEEAIEARVGQVVTETEITPEKVSKTSSEATEQKEPRTDYTALDMEKDMRSLGISRQTVKDWMKNRKAKKLAPTRTAFEETARELTGHPEYTPEEQLKMAVVKGWGGYKYKWFIRELQDGNNNNQSRAQSVAETVSARNYDEGF